MSDWADWAIWAEKSGFSRSFWSFWAKSASFWAIRVFFSSRRRVSKPLAANFVMTLGHPICMASKILMLAKVP